MLHEHWEKPHAHTCTNRLLPDEHCVLWALPCSLKIQQKGKEQNKCDPHPYSFLASNFLSQTPNLPSQCALMWGFVLHSSWTPLQRVSECWRLKMENILQCGFKENLADTGIFPVMCCTHFSLQLLNILNILLCVSVICWHILENWLRSSDANIKYAAFLPTATSRKWIYRRGPCTMPVRGQTLTSAAISRRPEWQKYAVICDIF